MARIPYPDAIADPRLRDVMGRVAQLNLLKMESHAEGIVEAIVRISDGVLNRSNIDPNVKIVAFLRLCEVVGSPYEFEQLRKVAVNYRLSPETIEAARVGGDHPLLDERQRLAARLAEELAVSPRCRDETFAALQAFLPPREIVELILGIGFYLMQSRIIETLEIEIEDPPVPVAIPEPTPALDDWRNGRG